MVDLLIPVNHVQARNVQIFVVLSCKVDFRMVFSNSVFKVQKSTDMDFDEQQGSLFADSLEWYYHAVICSDKRSTLLQECRIADISE